MKWFLYALKNTFNYKGRARRAEFGWFMLMNILIQLAVLLFFVVVAFAVGLGGDIAGLESDTIKATLGIGGAIIYMLYYVYQILVWLTTLSLTCRRMHDLGWSGWWQFILFYLLPILWVVLVIALASSIDHQTANTILATSCILYVIMVLVVYGLLLFKDGQRKENKYGADPKAIPQSTKSDEALALDGKQEIKQLDL